MISKSESKVSQKEKDKYHITYMWNLNYDTNEVIYEIEIKRTDFWSPKQGNGEGWTGKLGLALANCYTENG